MPLTTVLIIMAPFGAFVAGAICMEEYRRWRDARRRPLPRRSRVRYEWENQR